MAGKPSPASFVALEDLLFWRLQAVLTPVLMTDMVEESSECARLVETDMLYVLNEQEKMVLWRSRLLLQSVPAALPKFLQAVRWNDKYEVPFLLNTPTCMRPCDKLWRFTSPHSFLAGAVRVRYDEQLEQHFP